MIHALIADDHAVVRRGLKELLTDSGRIAVEGEAGTARETLEKVRERDWDVLILDINLDRLRYIPALHLCHLYR